MREHRLSDEYDSVKMQLYGLYKVATEGKCEEPKPKQDMVRVKRSPTRVIIRHFPLLLLTLSLFWLLAAAAVVAVVFVL